MSDPEWYRYTLDERLYQPALDDLQHGRLCGVPPSLPDDVPDAIRARAWMARFIVWLDQVCPRANPTAGDEERHPPPPPVAPEGHSWSRAESPRFWANQLNMSVTTFRRRLQAHAYNYDRINRRGIMIALDNLPESVRDRVREPRRDGR